MSYAEIPVFYPTYDEFKDFSAFIASIEARGAHKIGLAKIVPPKEWTPRKSGYKEKQVYDKVVENPIKQEVRGKGGIYSVFNIQQRSIKLSSFQKLASSSRYAAPASIGNDYEKLEKKYWQTLTSNPAIYGADVSGSFYDENQPVWNINHLGTILDDLVDDCGMKIQGVNTAYLYFGMWKASFAWHTEDVDLYSINYLHFGAPKQWYVIPPQFGKKFERFAASRFPSLARRCPAFLRHKMTVVSPAVLTKESIPYCKIIQYEGEFMITFPYGYHAGFNYGFNCAESTNFALERWIEYGKHSLKCTCREDMVTISMDSFVHKYQPELYDEWCRGINSTPHPEDHESSKINKQNSLDSKHLTNINKPVKHNKSSKTIKQLQRFHHQHVSDERYACIFRDLIKFDKQSQLLTYQHSIPLIRHALYRAQYQKISGSTNSPHRLLCLTARLVSDPQFSYSSHYFSMVFNGLKQADKYRQIILNGLWNYQVLNISYEQLFNQWLSNQSSACSICCCFSDIRSTKDSCTEYESSSIRSFLKSQVSYDTSEYFNELLQCSRCFIRVHRDCYESVCLGLDIDISDQYDPWLCQRCTVQQQALYTLDDRCSACVLRGGLLLSPRWSSSFIHAICGIYQAYQRPCQLNSCHYCWSFCPLDYRRISTHSFASCNYYQCKNIFHITCGLVSGCSFQINRDHSVVDVRCHLHANTSVLGSSALNANNTLSAVDDDVQEQLVEHDDFTKDENCLQQDNLVPAVNKRVPAGTHVLIHNMAEQKIGQITDSEIIYHYSVDFGDDTYSHDMLAEDIIDSDPSKLIIGSNVRIKWTDGTVYTCKYLGRQQVVLYHVKIGNETRQMQRNEFSVDVELPSPPPTPSVNEHELDVNRGSQLISSSKRQSLQQKQQVKRKRRRLILSSSSSSDES